MVKSDLVLLGECLDEAALDDETREAFTRMQADIGLARRGLLTPRQREWVEGVHSRLGLDPGTANLVTTGVVKPTDAERRSLRAMVESLGPKPLKPPGRRTA